MASLGDDKTAERAQPSPPSSTVSLSLQGSTVTTIEAVQVLPKRRTILQYIRRLCSIIVSKLNDRRRQKQATQMNTAEENAIHVTTDINITITCQPDVEKTPEMRMPRSTSCLSMATADWYLQISDYSEYGEKKE